MLRAIASLLLCSLAATLFIRPVPAHDATLAQAAAPAQEAGPVPLQLRRITQTPEWALSLNPSLSGDGSRLAFESTADLAQRGGRSTFHALLADLAPHEPSFRELSGTRAVSPAVSQDGSRVAFASNGDPLGTNADGNSELFIHDAKGLRQLTDTTPRDASLRLNDGIFNPSMSDDGRLIAFASNCDLAHTNAGFNSQIFLYDTTAQAFTQLTAMTGPENATDARLSGDGSRLAYIRTDGAGGSNSRQLLLYDLVQKSTRVVATDLPALSMAQGRALSDDGTRLVYAAETGAEHASQLFLYDALRDRTRQLTHLVARNADAADVPLQPTISGDGKRLAFATRRSPTGGRSDGSVELYLYDIPTGQFTQVTNAPAAASATVVSSLNDDGTLVAFNFARVLTGPTSASDFANNSEIYTAQLAPRPLFSEELRVSNAASLDQEPAASRSASLAPGSLAIAYGNALAFDVKEAGREPGGGFPLSLNGASLTVNGQPAQLFFVSPGQINFQVPPQTSIGPAEFVVTNSEGFITRCTVEITATAPCLFTQAGDGRGPALAFDAQTLQPGPFDPTRGTLRLILFATGARGGSQLRAAINGSPVAVESAQASTDLPGLDELHLLLPEELRGTGPVPLSLSADGHESNTVLLTLAGDATRDILINELLADPPDGLAGDANLDGTRSASQDEFVELVNTTTRDLDISNYTLRTRASAFTDEVTRHTFAQGTLIPAGTAVVLFGGANRATFNPHDAAFGGAQVFTSSTGGLSLLNSGGTVILRAPTGTIMDQLSYGGATTLKADANQSLTRSPDLTGRFSLHAEAQNGDGRSFSPGTRVDGSPFNYTASIARIEVSPAEVSILKGTRQTFTARAFDEFGNALDGVIFRWDSSVSSVASIDNDGLASALAEGTTQITATARGVESAPAILNVRPRERILTRIVVNPSSSALYPGGAQQFTARALDQDGQEITGLTFNWSCNSPQVATVDERGLTTAASPGDALITATARDLSGSATLKVLPPPLVINELLADPPDGPSGDANGDGVRSGTDDEFIELVNSSDDALDISGWTIRTKSFNNGANELTRHTFASGTTLGARDAIVVFGGGSFDPLAPAFGGAQVVAASGNSLSLTNSGLEVLVRDAAGNLVARFAYGTPADGFGGDLINQSLTRSPDIIGPFTRHLTASGILARPFSPGTKTDGSFFAPRAGRLSKVTLATAAANIFVDQSTEVTAQALDQFERPLPGVALSFATDDANVAEIGAVTNDPSTGSASATVKGRGAGSVRITATGMLDQKMVTSEAVILIVKPVPPRVRSVRLTPSTASINRGGSMHLEAAALDQNGDVLPGVIFDWSSTDERVASVDASGLVSGTGTGTATITASVADGSGGTVKGTATLRVELPLVINELLADVPPDNPATGGVIEGDSNRDGTRSADDDEFIELLNSSEAALDISGVRLFDSGSSNPRFTVPAHTTLGAGRALVIFGGGSPARHDPAFGGALVMTVADSATPSSTLSLNDGGDTISLRLAVGDAEVNIATLAYGAAGPITAPADQSLTRAPDAASNTAGGLFVAHTSAPGAAGRVFSPGTRSDGTPFNSPALTRIEILPATARIDPDATQTFKARAFFNLNGEETEAPLVSFIWETADASRATLSPVTGPETTARAVSSGMTVIRARAGGLQSEATLTVNPPPPVLTSVKLSPATASVTEGETTQFSAQALDQFEQPMSGVVISFNTSDASIAFIESVAEEAAAHRFNAIIKAQHAGAARITASASDAARSITSAASELEVKPAPPLIRRIALTPLEASIAAGATRQFTAQAFDQHEQPIAGVSFTWTSSVPSVAVINADGLATGVGAGVTQLTASAGGVNSNTATLNVAAPRVAAEGEVIINEALVSFATSTTQARRDFLELYNRTGETLDISGLLVSFRASGSSNSPGTVTLPGAPASGTTLIQPNGYFLIVNGADTFGVLADFNASGFDLNNTTGGIKIELSGVRLDGLAYQGGSTAPAAPFNAYGEGSFLVFTSGTTNDLIRSPQATDTGNNANDFRRNGTAASVSPRAPNPAIP